MVNKQQDISGIQVTQFLPIKQSPCYPAVLYTMLQSATRSPCQLFLHINLPCTKKEMLSWRITQISSLVELKKRKNVTLNMTWIQMRKRMVLLMLNQSISSFIEGRMDCFTNALSLKIIYIMTNFLPMCLSMILSAASEKREKEVLSRRKVGNTKGSFSFISIKNSIHTCYWKQSEKPMFTQSMRLFQEW